MLGCMLVVTQLCKLCGGEDHGMVEGGVLVFDCRVLGCPEGRSADSWVDFNLFGHQIVSHEVSGYDVKASTNQVDGDPVPVPHFGLALTVDQFHELARRVENSGVQFEITPHVRFTGQPGEQVRTKLQRHFVCRLSGRNHGPQ